MKFVVNAAGFPKFLINEFFWAIFFPVRLPLFVVGSRAEPEGGNGHKFNTWKCIMIFSFILEFFFAAFFWIFHIISLSAQPLPVKILIELIFNYYVQC